jgi:DNA-binding transcriptional LysR family regulator
METNEIRYFLAVAKNESVRGAAIDLGVTPSALSKAILRLETELEVKLIQKVGRNIKLTQQGRELVRDGQELLSMEKSIVERYQQNEKNIEIKLVGPEIPLSFWGPSILKKITTKFPAAKFSFQVSLNNETLDLLESYQADLALYASTKKITRERSTLLGQFSYKVFAGNKHPLFLKRNISVEEIIDYRFAFTNVQAFNLLMGEKSFDGWRDDKFPRKNIIYTDSLKSLDLLLQEGLALSYLPEFYGEQLGLKPLSISHCPYACKVYIYLCCHKYNLDHIWKLL